MVAFGAPVSARIKCFVSFQKCQIIKIMHLCTNSAGKVMVVMVPAKTVSAAL